MRAVRAKTVPPVNPEQVFGFSIVQKVTATLK